MSVNYEKLLCDMCGCNLSIDQIAEHVCFCGADANDIIIKGRLVTWQDFNDIPESDKFECLDEYKEVLL